MQSRFRGIIKPGNDVCLVVNRGWYSDDDSRWSRAFGKLSGTFAHTFRF